MYREQEITDNVLFTFKLDNRSIASNIKTINTKSVLLRENVRPCIVRLQDIDNRWYEYSIL